MIKVTADMFSGLPNPEWMVPENELRTVLRTIRGNRNALAPVDSGFQGLGFRGLVIEPMEETIQNDLGLPGAVRLAGGGATDESRSAELAERLISYMTAPGAATHPEITRDEQVQLTPELQSYLVAQLKEERPLHDIATVEPETATAPEAEAVAAGCSYEVTAFNPAFWNGAAYITKNNCYNYAANRRTNTFAQPGRASGKMYKKINCLEVGNGAVSDGATKACAPATQAPRWYMALVIAPGPGFVDFHWYRKASGGFWGHKPGGTAARNTDNNGRLITNPQTCARGPYTIFCGYMYAQKKMVIR